MIVMTKGRGAGDREGVILVSCTLGESDGVTIAGSSHAWVQVPKRSKDVWESAQRARHDNKFVRKMPLQETI